MSEPYVCVRQRAGPLVKALVTDNYGYLRRYGAGAGRPSAAPALTSWNSGWRSLAMTVFFTR